MLIAKWIAEESETQFIYCRQGFFKRLEKFGSHNKYISNNSEPGNVIRLGRS